MKTTMDLLDKALATAPAQSWHKELELNRNALHNARIQGHLAAPIAGAIAEKLGEDVDHWIVIAALESAKDSTCRDRMLKRYRKLARPQDAP